MRLQVVDYSFKIQFLYAIKRQSQESILFSVVSESKKKTYKITKTLENNQCNYFPK